MVADISEETLQDLCDALEDWRQRPESLIFSQFIKEIGIGWKFINQALNFSPLLNNIYEVTLATLCCRWFDMGKDMSQMPLHMQKVFLKYLNAYDQNARHLRREDQIAIAEMELKSITNYEREKFSEVELKDIFKSIYEANMKKKEPT